MPSAAQFSFLDDPAGLLPGGFESRPALVASGEEAELIERFQALDFKPFEFHSYFGNRRVVSFGWHYDFAASQVRRVADLPDFLLPGRVPAPPFPRRDLTGRGSAPVTRYSPRRGHRWAPRPAGVRGAGLECRCQP